MIVTDLPSDFLRTLKKFIISDSSSKYICIKNFTQIAKIPKFDGLVLLIDFYEREQSEEAF